jgi:hypothetical protein
VTLTKLDMPVMPLHPARYHTLYYLSPKTRYNTDQHMAHSAIRQSISETSMRSLMINVKGKRAWIHGLHASKNEWPAILQLLHPHLSINTMYWHNETAYSLWHPKVCMPVTTQLLCTVAAGIAITATRLTRTEKRWRRPPMNKSQWPLKSWTKRKEQLCKNNFMWLSFNNTQNCFLSFNINRTVRNN